MGGNQRQQTPLNFYQLTLLINPASIQDAVHSNRQQLCSTLPAHEYGYEQHTDYYTDTMGTHTGNYMKRSIFMEESWKKRLTAQSGSLVNIQNKTKMSSGGFGASFELLCAFRSEFYIWNVQHVPRGMEGFLMGSMHKQILHILTHTHTHIALISQETPLYLATADCELLSNAGFHWEVLWSHISIAVVSVAEVMGQSCRSRAAKNFDGGVWWSLWCLWCLFQQHHPSRQATRN